MVFFALFLFGLGFGSFLNVIAFRYNRSETTNDPNLQMRRLMGGRSHCMKCKRTLQWFDLVPILSFLFLRGKCRTCKSKISWQYPVVELVAGILFVFIPMFLRSELLGSSDLFALVFVAFWIFVFLVLLLMSVIDLRHYIIPDKINIVLFFSGFLAIAFRMFLPLFQQFFIGEYALVFGMFGRSNLLTLGAYHIVGSLIAGGFFWAVHALSKGRGMGFGDVKLAFALGFLLGWPDIFFAMIFSFLLGGAWSVFALLFRGYGMKSRLPFGPFFALGILWLVFFGEATLRWYFGLFAV